MLTNYINIAIRTLLKQKLYSGLNVLGLTLGLTGMLLIFFFVQHELSYDRYHTGSDNIYRIIAQQPGNEFMGSDRFVVTPASLADELRQTYPEVVATTTVQMGRFLIQREEAHYHERGIWADSSFFDVFPYSLQVGDATTALANPNQIVLTTSFAEKIFGDTNPIDQTLEVEQWGRTITVSVAGIMDDVPENTHLAFNFIVPIHAQDNYIRDLDRPTSSSYLTYLLLREDASPEALQASMPIFEQTYFGAEDAENFNLEVQPLTRIHLHNEANFDVGVPGDIRYVYLLGAIGLIILLLASINYMNLAVARSMKRAREVGLRQVIGARRRQIAVQFISESVLVSALALMLSIALAYTLLPLFGELVNRPLEVNWTAPWLIPGLIALVALVGFVSGSYPALYMARLQPVQSLKGTGTQGTGGNQRSLLQRSLIVLQYTASIALIAGSIVIFRQLQFVQDSDVGYDREHIVTYRLTGIDYDEISSIKQQVKRFSNVVDVVEVTQLPSNVANSTISESWEGRENGEELLIYQTNVGAEFFDVFNIDLVAGRPFSPNMASDSTRSIILNEKAIAVLNWTTEEAIGKRFMGDGIVVGVMRDFHLHSLHLPIAPLMLSYIDGWAGHIAVRLQPGDPSHTVAQITGMLDALTDYPVQHSFLEDAYENMYRSERRLGEMIGYFTLLAVLIASLGLFGLAAYSTERRAKEIGVRKVLGASVAGLVSLVSREFLVLVVLAIGFATPLAYAVAHDWLGRFAYRIELGPDVFVLAALVAIAIAFFTVSYLAIRAALTDPVKSLRYD